VIEYFYHEKDPDGREPACYLFTYRGCKYWSCYEIHLVEWFEKTFKIERED
jgi:hypothetical protein